MTCYAGQAPLVSFIGRASDCQLLALLARKFFRLAQEFGKPCAVYRILMPTAPAQIKLRQTGELKLPEPSTMSIRMIEIGVRWYGTV